MDELRKKILQPRLKTVELTNPHITDATLVNYQGDAYDVIRLVMHGDVPYKVMSEHGDVCTCQELTNQESADLTRKR